MAPPGEFAEDVAHVELDGALTDVEPLRDSAIAQPERELLQHLEFAGVEGSEWLGSW
jgi:hypothetical protein